VWSIDASEFAKKGQVSVGVAPQYCGALGKTANGQSGVFICYASPQGHALLEVKGLLHWQTHKVSEGQKGPIVAAFARLRVYVTAERTPPSARWLLLRNEPNGQIKYALSNAPEDLPMTELVRVSGARWPIERCFEEDKSELGLDHYEHRSWPAWHMRLVFLAQLFLLRLRLKYKKSPGVDSPTGPAVDRSESAGSEAGTRLPPGIRTLSSTAQLPSLPVSS